jgi:hypothetical protein
MIVLLSGKAGSGKDAAAALLVEEMNFTRLAFADMLKEQVSQATGIPLEIFHSEMKDRPVDHPSAKTYRGLLIEYAAKIRAVDPDIYSRQLVDQLDPFSGRYVISDWRYKSEEAYIRANSDMEVIKVCIKREGVVPSDDPSERDLDDMTFDVMIDNNGCISDLRDELHHKIRPFISCSEHEVSKLLRQLEYPCDGT